MHWRPATGPGAVPARAIAVVAVCSADLFQPTDKWTDAVEFAGLPDPQGAAVVLRGSLFRHREYSAAPEHCRFSVVEEPTSLRRYVRAKPGRTVVARRQSVGEFCGRPNGRVSTCSTSLWDGIAIDDATATSFSVGSVRLETTESYGQRRTDLRVEMGARHGLVGREELSANVLCRTGNGALVAATDDRGTEFRRDLDWVIPEGSFVRQTELDVLSGRDELSVPLDKCRVELRVGKSPTTPTPIGTWCVPWGKPGKACKKPTRCCFEP